MDANLLARRPLSSPRAQGGVVIVVALVVLVIMTLSALALIRSVGASYQIAGNLAFHQGATQASDRSTEAALASFLIPNNVAGNMTLYTNSLGNGYFATRADPAANQSWEEFWNASLSTNKRSLGADTAGNTVEYVIHRLCEFTGIAQNANCAVPPKASDSGESKTPGGPTINKPPQVYYRITTRIEGPRSTVSFTQTIVAL